MRHAKKVTLHIAPPAGARKRVARKVGTGKKGKGGFAPALIAPFALAGLAPILARLGSKIASKLGLGKKKRTTAKRGKGVVRAGATRTTGGRKMVVAF